MTIICCYYCSYLLHYSLFLLRYSDASVHKHLIADCLIAPKVISIHQYCPLIYSILLFFSSTPPCSLACCLHIYQQLLPPSYPFFLYPLPPNPVLNCQLILYLLLLLLNTSGEELCPFFILLSNIKGIAFVI